MLASGGDAAGGATPAAGNPTPAAGAPEEAQFQPPQGPQIQAAVAAAQQRVERELREAARREARAEARRRRRRALRAATADADARFCGGLLLLAARAHFSFLTPRDVQLAASLNQDYFLGEGGGLG